jgi:nucleotide-binding universal stress UspA family protein
MREQSAVQRRETAIPVQLVTAGILLNRKTEIDVMIARRAFELFEGRGGGRGHDVGDWITAELEPLRPYRHDLKESAKAVVFHAELPCSLAPDHIESIVGVADERDSDLIVLGWHGRTAVKRLSFGSVATAVIHAAPCSVELVRFRPERCESEACRLAERGES